jgi:mono/diheme cytochrome c family protein
VFCGGVKMNYIFTVAALFSLVTSVSAAGQTQLKRGEYLFNIAGCKSCHTDTKNKGKLLAGGTPLKTPFGTFYGLNITKDKAFGIGKFTDEDFIRALREGITPNGQHYFPAFPFTSFTKMTDQDMRDIKAYIFSLPAVAQPNKPNEIAFPFSIRLLQIGWKLLFFKKGVFKPNKEKSKEWNRGAYLVQALAHCSECHTPRNILGGSDTSKFLAGTPDGPGGDLAPNITPDPETGIGKWPATEIADVINFGMLPDGDFVGSSMADVSENLAKLTPQDLAAIVVYLQSLPPIRHKVSSKK